MLNAWVCKLIETLIRNFMLMIFLLNWIKPMLSFSKWENMLVFQDPSIFAIFCSYLPYCCLVWAQNCSTIQRIAILQEELLESLIVNEWIPILVPLRAKLHFKISRENFFRKSIICQQILTQGKFYTRHPHKTFLKDK